MKKGLNQEFTEEYKIQQLGKVFERRSNNPHLRLNKDQVMQSLLTTFTNRACLA